MGLQVTVNGNLLSNLDRIQQLQRNINNCSRYEDLSPNSKLTHILLEIRYRLELAELFFKKQKIKDAQQKMAEVDQLKKRVSQVPDNLLEKYRWLANKF